MTPSESILTSLSLLSFTSPLSLTSLSLFFFLSLVSLLVHPGGLAWSLCKKPRFLSLHSAIPGPVGLPFVGLGRVFTSHTSHRVLAQLALKFRASALMAFSVGSTRFVISSRPEPAREILNSSAFADRPVKESAYELLFHRAMGFAQYGEYWRKLRRVSATHLFCPKRVSGFGSVRREIGVGMVEEIKGFMEKNGAVEIRRVLHFGSLNSIMMSVFGKRFDFGEEQGLELAGLVREGYELLGMFNWSDHFALLGWLDLQGVRRRCKELVKKVNVFVGRIIEEHRERRRERGCHGGGVYDDHDVHDEGFRDFVDVLLDFEGGENGLNHSDMVAVLWEMIFRGTDTVAILLEWILARMVLHPDIQAKAQSEIDHVVGPSRPVSDSDLPNLPYLQAIVKETLRVHPPGPLLSWARLAIHDTHVGAHFIPAGTVAMVNMWAITHDEKIWANPDEFNPDRFVKEDVPIMGSDLRLAPFGSGRRVCPGKVMGLATVQLWLAQLLQNFKWVASVDHGVDLDECLKLSMEMNKSLVCKAISREDVAL
ncbi:hypothetical protein Cgig2_030739 [Carnegiea gigantea]|uniref:Cytochrome P450 78A5 n=1 Tax=Carnegiea gigantea TaxID=171969 RepID=A0A9Q1KSP8_9CARY|nr:hypothetical protein Cgig2_030739 [Carnegiea gigantea]